MELDTLTTKKPTIRITVDLSESMYLKLSLFAAKTRQKKTEIIRSLLNEALQDVQD